MDDNKEAKGLAKAYIRMADALRHEPGQEFGTTPAAQDGGTADTEIARKILADGISDAGVKALTIAIFESAPKWTTTPPTEPGWYWAIHSDFGPRENYKDMLYVVLIEKEVLDGPLVVWVPGSNIDHGWTFTDFAHWLGPLPVPDPPQ